MQMNILLEYLHYQLLHYVMCILHQYSWIRLLGLWVAWNKEGRGGYFIALRIALPTSTGYAGWRPLLWLACNGARAYIYRLFDIRIICWPLFHRIVTLFCYVHLFIALRWLLCYKGHLRYSKSYLVLKSTNKTTRSNREWPTVGKSAFLYESAFLVCILLASGRSEIRIEVKIWVKTDVSFKTCSTSKHRGFYHII